MKNFLLATVGLVALVGMAAPASAADMAVKAPHRRRFSLDLQLDRLLHWRQWRLGPEPQLLDFLDAFWRAVAEAAATRSGGLVGGQIGYRWQANQWVFGVEAQGDWADLSNTRLSLSILVALHSHQNRWHRPLYRPDRLRLERSAVVRKGRRGGDSNRFSILDNLTGAELASASATRWGGTVGVGFEYGFAPNWSFGVEYDHLFMGDANNSFTGRHPLVAAVLNSRISQDVDMVTLRINYRFGGYGAPIAARY